MTRQGRMIALRPLTSDVWLPTSLATTPAVEVVRQPATPEATVPIAIPRLRMNKLDKNVACEAAAPAELFDHSQQKNREGVAGPKGHGPR